MRSLRRLIIVLAELMQVVSLAAWTGGGAWVGARLTRMAIDYRYAPSSWPLDTLVNTGIAAGGLAGFAIAATAAAVVFALAQIELNTRDIARYYIERRRSEAAIMRAMK